MSQPSEADISVVLPVATLLPRYVPGDTVQKTESVVHITITQVGTVVYTQTATSYSYVPTYSTVSQVDSSNNPTSIPSSSYRSGDEVNMNAIIGGAVGGGFALIALVGFLFFFLCRRRSRRSHLYGKGYAVDNESHINYTCAETTIKGDPNLINNGVIPRQLIAPLQGIENETNIRQSKYMGEGQMEELVPAEFDDSYPKGYFMVNRTKDSINSDSVPSTIMDSSAQLSFYNSNRHVPNEAERPFLEERHIPHLKEHEPPHLKD
ncbi:hypothetical protein G6F66_003750 [Rhizopus arrhizus]|nr:hypothetical protein G6F66_003750 [Rhizopus arrhizus]